MQMVQIVHWNKNAKMDDRPTCEAPHARMRTETHVKASTGSQASGAGSDKPSWRNGPGLRERMSNISFKNTVASGSIGFGRRRQTTAPPQAMSNSGGAGSWREKSSAGAAGACAPADIRDADPDADARKRYAPYFQAQSSLGQGSTGRAGGLRRTQR